MNQRTASLAAADRHCERLLKHYENFTVASRLAPASLRPHLTRVYAYCRTVDDLGDESPDAQTATARLLSWRSQVQEMFAGDAAQHPVLQALAVTVRAFDLSAAPFLDLIAANLQDQVKHAYEDWDELLRYCMLSAAPVGRIVLRLSGVDSPSATTLSDDVCVGLQLANFAQDVSLDARRGRTYLLQDDIRRHGERGAVAAMCARALQLLGSGRTLERMTSGRLRLQLSLYRLGGEAIVEVIQAAGYSTMQDRPVVARSARVRILRRAAGDWMSAQLPMQRQLVLQRREHG